MNGKVYIVNHEVDSVLYVIKKEVYQEVVSILVLRVSSKVYELLRRAFSYVSKRLSTSVLTETIDGRLVTLDQNH